MTEPELTTVELLAEADALPERGTLGATLDAIDRTVRDDAVAVTVTLHGKLVALELSEQAMHLPSTELAQRISHATAEAAAAALADGVQAVSDVCGDHIAAALRPEPAPEAVMDDDDEFAPRSWAIGWN